MEDNLPDSIQSTLPDSRHEKYVEAATSDNTREAYQADIRDYLAKGFQLPARAKDIEQYLKDCAPNYNPRTLQRRIIALCQWHKLKQHPDPTKDPRVVTTLRGICRLHGCPKKQAAAIRLADLDCMITHLAQRSSAHAIRNQALLLVGFFGAFRCSELLSLQWEQIQFVNDGMIIKLPRSKVDQTGEGADCIIPFGNAARCPVRHLLAWKDKSRCATGAVFRPISKFGKILDRPMSQKYWMQLIREIATNAGLPQANQISSHSLRRGFATETARLGASMPAIQRHDRWRSIKTVLEYIEAGRQFKDSAVNVLNNWE